MSHRQSHRPAIAYVLMYLWTESWQSGCLGLDVTVEPWSSDYLYMLM